jgi:hypothetical protein
MATLIGEAASHVNTRARRRALVAGLYLALPSAVALTLAEERGGRPWLDVANSILLVVAMLALIVLQHLTHNSRTNPPSLLDERERAERDQAYRRAYRILTCGMGIVALYALGHMVYGWGWAPATLREWLAVWYLGGFAMAGLPGSVVAWTAPDFPADDPADAEAERAALRGVPLPSVRLRLLGALAVVGLALTVVQYAGLGLLPPRYGAGLFAGTSCGLLLGLAFVWNRERHNKNP